MEAAGNIHGNSYHGLLSVLRLYYWFCRRQPEGVLRTREQMVEINKTHHREETVSGKTARMLFATVFTIWTSGAIAAIVLGSDPRSGALGFRAIQGLEDDGTLLRGDSSVRLGEVEKAVPIIRDAIGRREPRRQSDGSDSRQCLSGKGVSAGGRLDEAESGARYRRFRGSPKTEAAYGVYRLEATRLGAEIQLARGQLDAAAQDLSGVLQRIGYPELKRTLGLPEALLTWPVSARAASLARSAGIRPCGAADLRIGHARSDAERQRRRSTCSSWHRSNSGCVNRTACGRVVCNGRHRRFAMGWAADHALTRQSERLARPSLI
jgi:hypothetical protein